MRDRANNIYMCIVQNREIIGHVVAVRWKYENRTLLWVTQQCVSNVHRNQGFSELLLEKLLEANERRFLYVLGMLHPNPFTVCISLLQGVGEAEWDREGLYSILSARLCPAGSTFSEKAR